MHKLKFISRICAQFLSESRRTIALQGSPVRTRFLITRAPFWLACLAAIQAVAIPSYGAGEEGADAPLPEFAKARLGSLRFQMNLRYGSGYASLVFSPDGKNLVATCDKG